MEGESETDSVDLDDLIAGGENAQKGWIKFMLDNKTDSKEIIENLD